MPWLFTLLAFFALPVAAAGEARVAVCHGYSCVAQAEIVYSAAQLEEVRRLLLAAADAPGERDALAEVVGRLYRWGGEQSAIASDRAGNFADGDGVGRMDCIDHSTSTTRLLHLLGERKWLRWHRVLEPQARYFLGLIANHWSAVIEASDGERYVVDSWFVNNGEPAVILPLDEWKKGAGPDV
jgi:hypothetical protein